MDKILAAFHKVWANLDVGVAHADDPYLPRGRRQAVWRRVEPVGARDRHTPASDGSASERGAHRMKSRGLFGRSFLDIEVRDHEIEPPDEGHVSSSPACGVCGTDVTSCGIGRTSTCLWATRSQPSHGGGEERSRPPAGEKVIVEDCTMCGLCADCKSGNPQLCRNLYNMEDQPGMSEYMSVRYNCLDKFEGLDYGCRLPHRALGCGLALRCIEMPTFRWAGASWYWARAPWG